MSISDAYQISHIMSFYLYDRDGVSAMSRTYHDFIRRAVSIGSAHFSAALRYREMMTKCLMIRFSLLDYNYYAGINSRQ